MSSIGERLRQERLRRGLDLNQICDLTKISLLMLEAIESDDLDKLPGTFFARSFVRQYAQALNLDEDAFTVELKQLAGFGQPAPDQPEVPAPAPQIVARPVPVPTPAARRAPNRHSLGALVGLLAIVAACTVFYQLWQRTRATAAKSPAVSVANLTPSPTETAPPAATSTPTPEQAAPSATPAETPAVETSSTPPPAVKPKEAPVPPAAAVAPAGSIRLELRATSEAWVRVVADGKVLYSGVLQPNEARVFEGADSMTLRAGNAGALAAVYNGKPMGELGSEGQVRTIQFTASGFTFVAPAPAATINPTDQP